MNNSTASGKSEKYSLIVYSGILGVIALPIVLGNLFTIVTFSKKKSGSHNAHILLINLAAADILVGAISIPMLIYIFGADSNWWAATGRTVINSTYVANDILAGLASIFSLVCIALERLYAIISPLKHRLATKRLYYRCIILIWLTSALIVILRFTIENRTFRVYIVLISFGLSFFLIFISYSALWCTVKTNKVSSAIRQQETTRERKLAKTLSLVTVVFTFTWLPFQVLNFYYNFAQHVPQDIFLATKILHYGNSMANPILYAFRMKDFRDSFRMMLNYKRNKEKRTRVTKQTLCKKEENNSAFSMDTRL